MLSDTSGEECVMHRCRTSVAKALVLTLVLPIGLFAITGVRGVKDVPSAAGTRICFFAFPPLTWWAS